jgi:hypothetical protein|tara:strand:+ start:462 stop:1262 length:801 start_codon:yes stop_codon:yes gene_type:complete
MTNQKSNGAVTTKAETLPAAKIEALEKMAGAGLETVTVDDLPQPRLKVLQAISPEVAGGKDRKAVEGAKAGLIYNNTTDSCYPEEGIDVIVCGYEKTWVEWQERGTGGPGAPINVFTPTNKPTDSVRGDDGKFRLPSGNYIEETANFYMLILNQGPTPEAVVMSLSKTGLKVARNWAYSLKNEFIQNPKTKKLFLAPSYYRIYRLSTEFTDNTKGAWWALKFEKGDFLNDEKVFDTAAAFSEQVRAGKVSVDYSDEESAAAEDTPF